MRRSDNGPLVANDAASKRLAKLESLLRSEVGGLIERELELPTNTLLTIVSVKVAADLSQARIGVSVLPETNRATVMAALASKTPVVQHFLNAKLRIYRVPKLVFFVDESLVQADRLDNLLDSLKR